MRPSLLPVGDIVNRHGVCIVHLSTSVAGGLRLLAYRSSSCTFLRMLENIYAHLLWLFADTKGYSRHTDAARYDARCLNESSLPIRRAIRDVAKTYKQEGRTWRKYVFAWLEMKNFGTMNYLSKVKYASHPGT